MTDHRLIGKLYLWSGLCFLLLGGLLAMLIRWQQGFPGAPVPLVGGLLFPGSSGAISPESYPKLFTIHGLVMIFFAITPVLIGALGSLVVPLQVGARELAFPRLNALGFGLFALAQGMMLASLFAPLGTASAGWTAYAPLSTNVGTPGWGQSMVVLALGVNAVATVLGGVNILTTVIRHRAPGMAWLRLPATTWGVFLASVLNVLFVPVLLAAAVLLLFDRHAGTHFFLAGAQGDGDPLAYQHLFWIFGHPEVYILILPAWGVVTDLLSVFSRKPAFAYPLTVGAMIAVTVMSGLVYGHHMYVSGMSPMLGQAFMAMTLAISVPSLVLGLNWLQTLWRGDIQLRSPMLYALGVIFVFGAGGLSGLFLGDMSLDVYLHDTLFVVGHFHLIMAAATFLAALAAVHYWAPLLFGRRLHEGLARAHFAISLPALVLIFSGLMLAGYSGEPRRLYDPYQYQFLQRLLPLNRLTSELAFLLLAAQGLFIVNLMVTLRRAPDADRNPWGAGSLEFSPAVGEVLRGPHVFAAAQARFLGQAEVAP